MLNFLTRVPFSFGIYVHGLFFFPFSWLGKWNHKKYIKLFNKFFQMVGIRNNRQPTRLLRKRAKVMVLWLFVALEKTLFSTREQPKSRGDTWLWPCPPKFWKFSFYIYKCLHQIRLRVRLGSAFCASQTRVYVLGFFFFFFCQAVFFWLFLCEQCFYTLFMGPTKYTF